MSSFYAKDFERQYGLALVLGSAYSPELWTGDRWTRLLAILDPIVRLSRGPASAQGAHLRASGKSLKPTVFGPTTWSDVVSGGRASLDDGDVFGLWAVFSPSDRQCAREQRAPDVYISVRNERIVTSPELQFNPSVLIAIGADIGAGTDVLDVVSDAVGALTSAVLVAKTKRSWGRATAAGYNMAISETQWFKGGIAGRPVHADILDEPWDVVSVASNADVCEDKEDQPQMMAAAAPPYRPGQLVRHEVLGEGRIVDLIAVGGRPAAVIDFRGTGRKTLVLGTTRLDVVTPL